MKKQAKRISSLILALAMLLGTGAMCISASAAETFEENGFYYTVSNGEATLTDAWEGEIPDTLGGYPVTKIGEKAYYENYHVEKVTIPDTVTEIANSAFRDATVLKEVEFGENSQLKTIGVLAFSGCFNLEEFIVPESVEKIENSAFLRCESLEKIYIGKNVKEIGAAVFYRNLSLNEIIISPENENFVLDKNGALYNKSLTRLLQYPMRNKEKSYTVPDTVTSIDMGAFANAYYLENIVLPDGITEIGSGMFKRCISLKSVNIPDTVETIGEYAFAECLSLRNINIPAKTTLIYYDSFDGCISLEGFDVSDENTVFFNDENGALYNIHDYEGKKRTGLVYYPAQSPETSWVIPETVGYVSSTAFTSMNLVEITLPANFEYKEGMFNSCVALEKVWVDENHPTLSNDENGILYNKDKTELILYPRNKPERTFVIPESVTLLGPRAFLCAENLSVVVAHENVVMTTGSSNSFYDCSMLTDVYYEGTSFASGYFDGVELEEDFFNQVEMKYEHSEGNHVHDYNLKVTTNPVCGQAGKGTYVCDCGFSKEVKLPEVPNKHFYNTDNMEIKEIRSCTSEGYGYLGCKLCGTPVEELYRIAVESHSCTVTAIPSTATAAGELTYTCNNCEHTETTEIPAGAKYIIYDVNGEMTASVYNPGDAITAPEAPVKEGLEFIGWKKANGETVELNTMPDENLVLTPAFGKADNGSGVTAVFDEDCFAEGTDVALVVIKFSGDRVPGGVYYQGENFTRTAIYDICFKVGEREVQPEAGMSVEISIPVPEGCESYTEFYIIHRHDGRQYDDFTVKAKNGRITFRAEKFSEFEIYVKSGVKVKSLPTKLSYNYKDALDLSGLAFEKTDADGNKTIITDTSKMTVTGYDAKKIGTQTVTVEYEGVTAEFNVTVSYSWWQMIIRILLLGFLWY